MSKAKAHLYAFRSVLIAIAIGILMLLAPANARSQDGPGFRNADLIQDSPASALFIALSFKSPFDPAAEPQILQASSYRVTRIKKGEAVKDRFLGIERVTLDPDEEGGPSSVRVYLTTPLDLVEDDVVTVYYVANIFNGKELKAPIISLVTPATSTGSAGAQAAKRAEDAGGFSFKPAKGRADAHLYFAGELNRASGTSFNGSGDLKAELPLPWLRTVRHELLPFLDLKASNDPKADPDSIKAGLESKLILAQAGLEYSEQFPVVGIAWYNTAKIEGDRDFDNVNAIVSSTFLFPFKPIFLTPASRDRAFVEFTPFTGIEAGKNLHSPVDEANGHGLVRVLIGSHVYARLYQGSESFARLTLDGVYERRWPLLDEVGFRNQTVEVANGKDKTIQVPAFFGSRPRQWAEVKLNYNFNQFFSVFTGYQYGELPPAYKLVDHSLRIGLLVKAKIK